MKLIVGYILATHFLEKQKPRSISTDLVALGSKATHFAANRSQQADPIVAFWGVLYRELNLLNLTFIITMYFKSERKKKKNQISNNRAINIYTKFQSKNNTFLRLTFKVVNNNVLVEINIWPFCSQSMRQKILLIYFQILFCSFFPPLLCDFFKEIFRNFLSLIFLRMMSKLIIFISLECPSGFLEILFHNVFVPCH